MPFVAYCWDCGKPIWSGDDYDVDAGFYTHADCGEGGGG